MENEKNQQIEQNKRNEQNEQSEQQGKKITKKVVIEWIKTLLYPIIIALLILMVIRPTVVKEHSMLPTINENDYVVVYKLAYKFGEQPEYKDIVVFESDVKLDERHNKYLIKRVIGTPGDTVEIFDGVVYLNGKALDEPYIIEDMYKKTVEEMEIPEGMYFVMGDNRPISMDSRDAAVGLVSEDRIMGKVVLRLFPFDQIGPVD